MQTKKILSIATVIATLSTAPSYAHNGGCLLDKDGSINPVLSQRQRLSLRNSTTLKDDYFSKHSWKSQIYARMLNVYDFMVVTQTKEKGRPLNFEEAEQVLIKVEKFGKTIEKEWIEKFESLRAKDQN